MASVTLSGHSGQLCDWLPDNDAGAGYAEFQVEQRSTSGPKRTMTGIRGRKNGSTERRTLVWTLWIKRLISVPLLGFR